MQDSLDPFFVLDSAEDSGCKVYYGADLHLQLFRNYQLTTVPIRTTTLMKHNGKITKQRGQ